MIDVMRWAAGVDVWWVRRWWEAADARGLAVGELGAVTLLVCEGGIMGCGRSVRVRHSGGGDGGWGEA